jgi:shikimate 5-dehydrogenase
MMTSPKASSFAAVLGDPVHHSYTPLEHSEFFHKRNIPVFAIQVHRGEWEEALACLREFGLTHAAVTSPHKLEAARCCGDSGLIAVNTLFWNSHFQKWQGTSTDEQGFSELIEGIGMLAPLQQEIFVWGGGGTMEVLQKALPKAQYFSSRTGELRRGERSLLPPQPKILIWAAPRLEGTLFPPVEWIPKMVFDLNYKEDSMGKEYAQKSGAGYESGLVMFNAQAREQRLFWKKCEEPI